jgi:hypothetical protein
MDEGMETMDPSEVRACCCHLAYCPLLGTSSPFYIRPCLHPNCVSASFTW